MEQDCTKCGAILTEHIPKMACGNSCHECGRYAYFADQPFYLYLLTNQPLMLHKVGIGSVGKDKNHLKRLIQDGWTVYGLWHAGKKGKTFQWEQAVFKQLQARFSAMESDSPGFVGRWDGHWVESVSAQAISASAIAELIKKIVLT